MLKRKATTMNTTTDPIKVQTDDNIETIRRAVIDACELRLDDAYRRGFADALDGIRPPAGLVVRNDEVTS